MFGLVKENDEVIIDSAPIEASQNFARSNSGIKINEVKLKEFFNTMDFTPAMNIIAPACNRGRKRKYSNDVILTLIAFEKLCGFLCSNQALTYLKKHPNAAKIVGFNNEDIPSTLSIINYLKRIPPLPWLMRVIVALSRSFLNRKLITTITIPYLFFSGRSKKANPYLIPMPK